MKNVNYDLWWLGASVLRPRRSVRVSLVFTHLSGLRRRGLGQSSRRYARGLLIRLVLIVSFQPIALDGSLRRTWEKPHRGLNTLIYTSISCLFYPLFLWHLRLFITLRFSILSLLDLSIHLLMVPIGADAGNGLQVYLDIFFYENVFDTFYEIFFKILQNLWKDTNLQKFIKL